MRRSEEAIDQVLKGLRDVEAPEGMERRVLGRMEEMADRRSEGTPGWIAGWRWIPRAGVLAAVLLMLAGVGGLRWRMRGAAMEGRVVAPARQAGASPKQKVGGGKEFAGSLRTALPVAHRSDGGERTERRGLRTEGATPGATTTLEDEARREESVAMAEMQAPSLVAPSLPLTKEERLLQRAAQRGGADEMAALREEERAREGAASQAEFREFFGPPRSEVSE